MTVAGNSISPVRLIEQLLIVCSRLGYNRLHAGIFRFCSSNGLLIASANFGTISVKHAGGRAFETRIVEATRQIVENIPKAFDTVERWKGFILPRSAQMALAEKAFDLKPLDGVRPAALLTARREEDYTDSDCNRDLWRTFNVIEENVLQGGVQGVNPRGRKTRTRYIRSVTATINLNRSLWQIAEQVAEWNRPWLRDVPETDFENMAPPKSISQPLHRPARGDGFALKP